MKKVTSSIFLTLTALIWGVAFLAQSVGMEYVKPFTFNGIRFFIGVLVLVPFIVINALKKKGGTLVKSSLVTTVKGGVICGLFLFSASTLQQYALVDTSPGKAGFMTALYIIIVPLIGIFRGKKPGIKLVCAAMTALVGLYFLCFEKGSFTLESGDILLFLCALLFAGQILSVDYYSPKIDSVLLSAIQFFVCAVLSVIPMLLIEKPEFSAVYAARVPILYAGVLSCGVAYTFQIIGQKGLNPTVASLIMSLESVFALLGEYVYSKICGTDSFLTGREIFGCAVVFAAIILAQLPDKLRNSVKSEKTN